MKACSLVLSFVDAHKERTLKYIETGEKEGAALISGWTKGSADR